MFQVLTNLLELEMLLPPRTTQTLITVVGSFVELADKIKCEPALIAFEKEGCLEAIENLTTSNNEQIKQYAEEVVRLYSEQTDIAITSETQTSTQATAAAAQSNPDTSQF